MFIFLHQLSTDFFAGSMVKRKGKYTEFSKCPIFLVGGHPCAVLLQKMVYTGILSSAKEKSREIFCFLTLNHKKTIALCRKMSIIKPVVL